MKWGGAAFASAVVGAAAAGLAATAEASTAFKVSRLLAVAASSTWSETPNSMHGSLGANSLPVCEFIILESGNIDQSPLKIRSIRVIISDNIFS